MSSNQNSHKPPCQKHNAVLAKEPVDVERITLTMEVTYSDYEEIFIKRALSNCEESCAKIMHDTNTEIQFPDRDEPNADFIHQRFCPVVLMFAVSERLREGVPYKKLENWIKDRIDDGSLNFPTLVIQTLPQQMSTSFKEPVIRISGRVGDEEILLRACERLRELLFEPEVAEKISFSTHMEVPASQRSQIVGTPDGAQLLCFNAGSEDLRARIEVENRLIKFYDEMLRVSVRVIPSELESLSVLPGDQMRHFISLRTSEYNVGALYAVMRRVLKRGDEIPMVTPTDYAEMNPLVHDLLKHACEVNFRDCSSGIVSLPNPVFEVFVRFKIFLSNFVLESTEEKVVGRGEVRAMRWIPTIETLRASLPVDVSSTYYHYEKMEQFSVVQFSWPS
ncbi:unnamed protein product [Heligmosomoides polygyrus]|uniref:KH_10 domain-containing protein n=1 Tax=Heligmosomoides polygyrus TaxID=6339 RepID=A0A183GEV0_HELPZ|nr:unnamed protein product [Heligmosomoides polygyrus]